MRRSPMNTRLGGPHSHSERFGDSPCRQSNPVSSNPPIILLRRRRRRRRRRRQQQQQQHALRTMRHQPEIRLVSFRFVSFQYSVRLP
jgi:hypothetical protein